MRKKTQKNSKKRTVISLSLGATLIVLIALVAVLEFSGKTSFTSIGQKAKNENKEKTSTTSTVGSAQSNYNGGLTAEENKDPGNTIKEDRGTAVVTDNGGATSSNTANPQPSSTGEITIFLPQKNSTLKSGQEVSGNSTLSSVQYRLIDSVSGVIATGTLNVVNGKFSGILEYTTSATEGRLDIFGTKNDASEFSAVEIPVRFK